MTHLQKLTKETEKEWNKIVKETKSKQTITTKPKTNKFNMSIYSNKLESIQL